MTDLIAETIEKSWHKFNPKLTAVCLHLIKLMNKEPPPDKKCWRFMQTLFMIQKAHPMNLPYYWYKEGVVVDPASLTQQTGGLIKFKWDEECSGCQIEHECPCQGKI